MNKMNTTRIAIGSLVAGVLLYIGDAVVHGVVLKSGWQEVMTGLGRPVVEGDMSGMGYFAAYDLCKGVACAWLYAAMRPRFGAGPKTAVLAGLAVWALSIPIALDGLIPMHFFGRKFALMWSLVALVPTVIGAVVAGLLYKEDGAPAAATPAPK